MKRVAQLLRPTLARRLMAALLLSFGVVWLVLIAFYYSRSGGELGAQNRQQLRLNAIAAVLERIDDPVRAAAAMESYSDLLNENLRQTGVRGSFVLQLEERQGRRLFVSREGGGASLHGTHGQFTRQLLRSERYSVARRDGARWSVLVGEPLVEDAWLLRSLGGDLALSVLIAMPIVLLPAWFAVTRGLRPLRRLSELLSRRGPDDLAPLDFHARYAELQPVAGALERLLAQLRERIGRERAFVQDAAHELRTPLAVIAAQAHVLAKAEGAPARMAAARTMEHAVGRASHLVQQLLSLAQLEGAAQAAATVDVAQLVRAELAALAPQAMDRHIELSLDSPDTLPFLVDGPAFASIVQNLAGNAVKYGHDKGQVALSLALRGGALELQVADDGPGIEEGQRELVFERFHRGAGQTQSGSGLGLAIVRQAAMRLRGTVRLEAGPGGRGCRFIVSLPAP